MYSNAERIVVKHLDGRDVQDCLIEAKPCGSMDCAIWTLDGLGSFWCNLLGHECLSTT